MELHGPPFFDEEAAVDDLIKGYLKLSNVHKRGKIRLKTP